MTAVLNLPASGLAWWSAVARLLGASLPLARVREAAAAALHRAMLGVTLLAPTLAHAFGFDDVVARARTLVAQPFDGRPSPLPDELLKLSYDQLRDIRFRTDRALWRDAKLPFEVAFFHPGLYFDRPIRVHEVDGGKVREIVFDPANFNYGKNDLDMAKLRKVGFAGFRVHFPLNTPQYKDEVLVFQGASYFRALGRNQRYGLSARGLAVDTVQPAGEEFPRFEEFWLVKPAAGAQGIELYALLNSRRVTGAYRFLVTPGADTVVEVQSRLFLRPGADQSGMRLGIAPLTSMFSFGENQRPKTDDYRPEVHDSDGLAIAMASGEWIWRPLANPSRIVASSFSQPTPRGFGLQQRDRDFHHYEDLEAHYEKRPSAWIEPVGSWGNGRVELTLIPTPDETHDNIVSFWVPDSLPPAGTPLDFSYRVRWQMENETRAPNAWVVQTRRGHGYVDPKQRDDKELHFAVDFEGPALRALAPEAELKAEVSVGPNGQLLEAIAFRHAVTGGWRMSLRIRRSDPNQPVELRGFLRDGANALSETWSYLLPPE
jgi:glucans biosynthesis protein